MKRKLCLLLATLLLFSVLAGCGNKDKNKDNGGDANVPDTWTGDYAQILLLNGLTAHGDTDMAASVPSKGRYVRLDNEIELFGTAGQGLHLYVADEPAYMMDNGNITFVTPIGEGVFYIKTENGKGIVRYANFGGTPAKTVFDGGDIRQIFLTGNTLNLVNAASGKLERIDMYAMLDGSKPQAAFDLPDKNALLTMIEGAHYYLSGGTLYRLPMNGGKAVKLAEGVSEFVAANNRMFYKTTDGLFTVRVFDGERFPGEPEDDCLLEPYQLRSPSIVGSKELLAAADCLLTDGEGKLYFHSGGSICTIEVDGTTEPYESDGKVCLNAALGMVFNKDKNDDPLPGKVLSLSLFDGTPFAFLECADVPGGGFYWLQTQTAFNPNAAVLPDLELNRETFVCAAGSAFTLSVTSKLLPGEKIAEWSYGVSGNVEYDNGSTTAKVITDVYAGAAYVDVTTSMGRHARCSYITADPNNPDDFIRQYQQQSGLSPVAASTSVPKAQTLTFAGTPQNSIPLNNEMNLYDEGRGYEDYSYVEMLGIVSITIEPTDMEMEKGDEKQLMANTSPRYLAHLVEWYSADPAVAYPMYGGSGQGVSQVSVRAMGAGTTTITARLSDRTFATASVSIKRLRSDNVELPANEAIATGASMTLKATLKPDKSNDIVRWQSEDDSIVSVRSRGGAEAALTAHKEGEVTVTATIENGKQAKCLITVRNKFEGNGLACSMRGTFQGFYDELLQPEFTGSNRVDHYYPTRAMDYVFELTLDADTQVEQWAASAVVEGWFFIFDTGFLQKDRMFANDGLRYNSAYFEDTGVNPTTFMPGDTCVIHLSTKGKYYYPAGSTVVSFRYYDKNGIWKFTYPGAVMWNAPDKNGDLPPMFDTKYATERTLDNPGKSVWYRTTSVNSSYGTRPYHISKWFDWDLYHEWDYSQEADQFAN